MWCARALIFADFVPLPTSSHEFEDQDWDEYNDICTLKIFNRTENAVAKVFPNPSPQRISRTLIARLCPLSSHAKRISLPEISLSSSFE